MKFHKEKIVEIIQDWTLSSFYLNKIFNLNCLIHSKTKKLSFKNMKRNKNIFTV